MPKARAKYSYYSVCCHSVDIFILFEILYVLERVMACNMEWAVMCYMGLVQFNFGLSICWKKLKFKIQFSCKKKSITTWTLLGSCLKQAQKMSFGTWASLGYFLFCDELNRHKGSAMSSPSHHHISRLYFLWHLHRQPWHNICDVFWVY